MRLFPGRLVLLFLLSLAAPSGATTVDLEDLKSLPAAPQDSAGAVLPPLSEMLDSAAGEALAEALRLLRDEDYAGAEAAARPVTEAHPEAPEGWYVLGLALAGLHRDDEALAALDAAAARYAVNAEPLVMKGDLLLSLGRRDEAIAAWQAAAARDRGNWRAQERLAALAEAAGDREAALAHYETSLADGDALRVYPRLQAARLSLLLGDPAKAEALLDPVADAAEAPDELIDYLARAKAGLDKVDEAAALFDRLIEGATSARPYLSRAQLHLAGGDLAAAEALLQRAALAFPEDPAVMLEQGKVLGAAGRYDEALERFVAGLEKAPENAALLKSASLAEARLGRSAEAVAHARTLAALPGASGDDLVWLASLLEGAGQPEEAAGIYRDALARDPQNWVALNNLASLMSATAPDEAVALAEQAVALAPEVPTVQDTLGWAQLHAGRLDAAAATFEALRIANPDAALPLYRLGVVRQEQGRADEGRALLEQALALDPGFRYAEDARERLQ